MARLCQEGRPLMGDPRDMITIERWRSWEVKLREVAEASRKGRLDAWIGKHIESGLKTMEQAMDWAIKEAMEEAKNVEGNKGQNSRGAF